MKEIKEAKGIEEVVVIKIAGAVLFAILIILAGYSLVGIFQETDRIFSKEIKTVSTEQGICLPSEHVNG